MNQYLTLPDTLKAKTEAPLESNNVWANNIWANNIWEGIKYIGNLLYTPLNMAINIFTKTLNSIMGKVDANDPLKTLQNFHETKNNIMGIIEGVKNDVRIIKNTIKDPLFQKSDQPKNKEELKNDTVIFKSLLNDALHAADNWIDNDNSYPFLKEMESIIDKQEILAPSKMQKINNLLQQARQNIEFDNVAPFLDAVYMKHYEIDKTYNMGVFQFPSLNK